MISAFNTHAQVRQDKGFVLPVCLPKRNWNDEKCVLIHFQNMNLQSFYSLSEMGKCAVLCESMKWTHSKISI